MPVTLIRPDGSQVGWGPACPVSLISRAGALRPCHPPAPGSLHLHQASPWRLEGRRGSEPGFSERCRGRRPTPPAGAPSQVQTGPGWTAGHLSVGLPDRMNKNRDQPNLHGTYSYWKSLVVCRELGSDCHPVRNLAGWGMATPAGPRAPRGCPWEGLRGCAGVDRPPMDRCMFRGTFLHPERNAVTRILLWGCLGGEYTVTPCLARTGPPRVALGCSAGIGCWHLLAKGVEMQRWKDPCVGLSPLPVGLAVSPLSSPCSNTCLCAHREIKPRNGPHHPSTAQRSSSGNSGTPRPPAASGGSFDRSPFSLDRLWELFPLETPITSQSSCRAVARLPVIPKRVDSSRAADTRAAGRSALPLSAPCAEPRLMEH